MLDFGKKKHKEIFKGQLLSITFDQQKLYVNLEDSFACLNNVPYFSDCKIHFPAPKKVGGNLGASYRLNMVLFLAFQNPSLCPIFAKNEMKKTQEFETTIHNQGSSFLGGGILRRKILSF